MKKNFSQLEGKKRKTKWIKCINQCESLKKVHSKKYQEEPFPSIDFFIPKTKHLGKTKLNLNLYQQKEGSCGKVKASTEGRHKVPQETLGKELLYLSDTL